ncbi:MAG: hypothetical protein PHT51_05460, partial [Patescibacteria group bacterium]|nr:hypothetical protein [Patescibacteria group bacterium]
LTNKTGGIQIVQILNGRKSTWVIATSGGNGKLLVTSDLTTERTLDSLHPIVKDLCLKAVAAAKERFAKEREGDEIFAGTQKLEKQLQGEQDELRWEIVDTFPQFTDREDDLVIIQVLSEPLATDGETKKPDPKANEEQGEETEPGYYILGERLDDEKSAEALFTRQEELREKKKTIRTNKRQLTALSRWLDEDAPNQEVNDKALSTALREHHPELNNCSVEASYDDETLNVVTTEKKEEELDVLPPDLAKIVAAMYALQPEMFSPDMIATLGLVPATPAS